MELLDVETSAQGGDPVAQARSDADLLAAFRHAAACYDFDRVVLSVIVDPHLPQDCHGRGVLDHFPADFRAYYATNDCIRYDPILRAALKRKRAFAWEQLEAAPYFTARQAAFMAQLKAYHLHQGVAVPIRVTGTLNAIAGFARSAPSPSERAPLEALARIGSDVYAAYKAIHRLETSPATDWAPLSTKERGVLNWVAGGKTDDEIAEILSISRNTVDSHMRNIYRKLNAHNRVSAVVAGIRQGHICP
jgi:LuxR family quorum sensing-dependent transcriptional regulator